MAQEKVGRCVGVHDGTFHADEVTAAALLIHFGLIDREKIIRTRDPKKLATCEFVCDVGGIYDPKKKLFDHHQSGYKGHLSSAGMILLYLKEQGVLAPEEFDCFNNSLIIGVDDHDNGRSTQEVGYCSFSHVIANFNPLSYEAEAQELDAAFQEALHFALGHLERLHHRFLNNVRSRKIVSEAMGRYRVCLFFEKALPWLESFFALGGREHPALFVIMPAGAHWKLRAIPPDYEHRMDLRLPLPSSWAGLLEEDLKKVSGIPGAIFCHKGRFTSVWETKEDAIEALKYILQTEGIEHADSF